MCTEPTIYGTYVNIIVSEYNISKFIISFNYLNLYYYFAVNHWKLVAYIIYYIHYKDKKTTKNMSYNY